MDIIRVFPRRTEATPDDPRAIVGEPPKYLPDGDPLLQAKEIHVSVAFTFDRKYAEYLAYQWEMFGIPVKIGGPAYGDPGGEFIPGMYLKKKYTITSRGCPNHCWFCRVPKVAGKLRELPIHDGTVVQDDNLLACSEQHIKAVMEMLKRQKERPKFTGGLEAKLLKSWHVELLQQVKPVEMFFAYDTPDDYEPLIEASKMMDEAGFTLKSRKKCAYVLIGYKNDTFEKAEARLIKTLQAGYMPFAMLYKDEEGYEPPGWGGFQRLWSRPAIIVQRNKEFFK